MQLTGRTLVLALGACLVGGAAFGLVTSIAGAAPRPAAPVESVAASPASHSQNLGDDVATFPLDPSPSPDAQIIATSASPVAVESTTPTASPSREPTPKSMATNVTPAHSPRPVSTSPSHPQPASAQSTPGVRITQGATPPPRNAAPPSHTSARAPKPSVSPAATRPLDGWHPPALHVGANDIAPPPLSSGADVGMIIGCSPSAACSLDGGTLTIEPDAAAVNVSWSAPRTRGYLDWQASVDWAAS
jgi:hypothetical protein